jgi:hypothetical protein
VGRVGVDLILLWIELVLLRGLRRKSAVRPAQEV